MSDVHSPIPKSRDRIFKAFLYGVVIGLLLGPLLLEPGKYPYLRYPFGALIGGLIGLALGLVDRLVPRKNKSVPVSTPVANDPSIPTTQPPP